MYKNALQNNISTSNTKNPSKRNKFIWTTDKIEKVNEIFVANSHQLIRSQPEYSKKNTYYYNFNKCGIIKKSWRCKYYACLPCQFIYRDYNYKILKELKEKIINRYPCYLITYRIPLLNDDLATNYKLLNNSIESFKHSSFGIKTNYEKFLEEVGYISSITSFECPFSPVTNLHLTHNHEVIIAQNQITKQRSLAIEKDFNRDYQSALNSVYSQTYTNNNFNLIYDFTNNTKIYDDDCNHYTAILLLNNFNSIEYLSNPYKLLHGFESIVDKSIQEDKRLTYSPYLNALYDYNRDSYLNFVNNLPFNITNDFKKNPYYQSEWLKYGNVEGIDLREYFKIGKFKGKSTAEIQIMKDEIVIRQDKNNIKKHKNYENLNLNDDLFNLIQLFYSLPLKNHILRDELKKMRKEKTDINFVKTNINLMKELKEEVKHKFVNDKLQELENGEIELELINKDKLILPIPETIEEFKTRQRNIADKIFSAFFEVIADEDNLNYISIVPTENV